MDHNHRHPQQQEEQEIIFSHFCPSIYAQMPEGARPRRRKKKGKGDAAAGEAAKKRKLSAEQVNFLEENFGTEHKLESARKVRLASELGLDPRQVAVWFQNRRARWKNKQLEEEYSRLKTTHDSVVVEKCRLEAEVYKLKEQLQQAESEIRKLAESGSEAERGGSPSTSFSAEAAPPQQLLLGGGACAEEDDSFLFMADCHYSYISSVEWMNWYGL